MSPTCTTRYPVLLVHGISAFTRQRPGNYWGRIPEALRSHGADVHLIYLDGWGSVQNNAQLLKQQLLQVLQQTNSQKVNIIAHSKGGLDARYCLSALDCAQYTASLTTLTSPNNGCQTIDWLMRWFGPIVRAIALPINWMMRRLGDITPDFYAGCQQLSTTAMQNFNRLYPPPPEVYCQSYACAMKRPRDDLAMAFTYLVVRKIEGENDGLVTPKSAAFANFKGILQITPARGLSHREIVDGRRKPFMKPGVGSDGSEHKVGKTGNIRLCEKDCHPGQNLTKSGLRENPENPGLHSPVVANSAPGQCSELSSPPSQDLARTPQTVTPESQPAAQNDRTLCHLGLEPRSRDSVAGSLPVLHDDSQINTGQNTVFAQTNGSLSCQGSQDKEQSPALPTRSPFPNEVPDITSWYIDLVAKLNQYGY